MKPFYAKFGSGESRGIDAFAVDWSMGFGYFHPPVGLITRGIRKAERARARGLLVAPDWPGSSYCMLLEKRVKEGKMIVMERFRPRIVCLAEIVSNTFKGMLKFDMIVVEFKF